jgi:hypothetical protein
MNNPTVTLQTITRMSSLLSYDAIVWARANLEYLNSGNRLLGTSTKLEKGSDLYSSYVLYLQPADKVAARTLCPMAELAGCKEACLITSGRLGMSSAQAAATRRTVLMLITPEYFEEKLLSEIDAAERKALKTGIPALFRLNGTSDINFTHIIDQRPDSLFYDYSKLSAQLRRSAVRPNYDVTYSASMYSERSKYELKLAVLRQDKIAVAFNTKGIKSDTLGTQGLYSFDTTDLRHLDPRATIGSLTSKGSNKAFRAREDVKVNSFFVTSANAAEFNSIIARG